jgi:hypothetical protein
MCASFPLNINYTLFRIWFIAFIFMDKSLSILFYRALKITWLDILTFMDNLLALNHSDNLQSHN